MIPVLVLARRRPWASLAAALALGLGAGRLIAAWPAPNDRLPDLRPPPARGHLVALTPTEWSHGDPTHCLAYMDEWLAHPNWSVRVTEERHGCTGSEALDTITVRSDGTVRVEPQEAYPVEQPLMPLELDELRALAAADCTRTDEVSYSSGTYAVRWGGPDTPVTEVPAHSEAGELLRRVLDTTTGRADFNRTNLLRVLHFELTLEIRGYAGERPHRTRRITLDDVGEWDMTAVSDWVLRPPVGRHWTPPVIGRGHASLAGIGWSFEIDSFQLPERVWRLIDEAAFVDR